MCISSMFDMFIFFKLNRNVSRKIDESSNDRSSSSLIALNTAALG